MCVGFPGLKGLYGLHGLKGQKGIPGKPGIQPNFNKFIKINLSVHLSLLEYIMNVAS